VDTERWDEPTPTGQAPEPRYRHAACLVRDSMLIWGGYVLRARVPEQQHPNPHPLSSEGYASMNADECFLLQLSTQTWSRPTTKGVPPTPRGGHTLTLVDSKLLIFGGGDLYFTFSSEQWHERDLPGLHWLDTTTWTYGTPAKTEGSEPAVRGGHTAHLLPHDDGRLGMLVLGGRNYVAPAEGGHLAAGEHFGRDDAHLLLFGHQKGA